MVDGICWEKQRCCDKRKPL